MTKFQNFCPKSYTQSVKKLDFEQEGSPVPQTLLRFIPHRRLNPNTALPGHKVLDSRATKLLLLLTAALKSLQTRTQLKLPSKGLLC